MNPIYEKSARPVVPMKIDTTEPVTHFGIEETPNGFIFRPPTSASFRSVSSMFRDLRFSLSDRLGGRFLMVKFASRVHCSQMPMIHDPADLVVYLDPLQPYRDPVYQVNVHRVIELHRFPSLPSFFRKVTRHNQFHGNPSVPSDPSTSGSRT